MEIRLASRADIPAIVALLKSSLGETSSPKTEAYWQWKHFDNPFGASPVWVSEEQGAITGVRAFMRWQWQQGSAVYSALRAVDTATHPQHQGKGIFKKLTLALADECAAAGDQFIFNTPNDQSRPGYLKMGWVEAGKLPVALLPNLQALLPAGKAPATQPVDWQSRALEHLCYVVNQKAAGSGAWFTPKSPRYLHWRYAINPVQAYHCFADDTSFVALYARRRGRLRELRVSELLTDPRSAGISKAARRFVMWHARRHHAAIISFSPQAARTWNNPLAIKGSFGPILTLRRLAANDTIWPSVATLGQGLYQLGDLELF